jgi:hypothetical protein
MIRISQMIAVVLLIGGLAYMALNPAQADGGGTPALSKLPAGYRDWRLISVAHEEGKQNDIRAILGNDTAIKAFRDGSLPFPTAPSLRDWPGSTSRQRKTTRLLVSLNRSSPEPPRTFNSWSKTPPNTHRREVGVSFSSMTENSQIQRDLALALPVTCPSRPGIMSSIAIHRSA